MPAKIIQGQFGPQLPESWARLLAELSLNPVTTTVPSAGAVDPLLKSLGKPISELLDLVLKTEQKVPGLPRRVKLTEWNARKGTVGLRPEAPQGPKGLTSVGVEPAPIVASPADLDALINSGQLSIDQPPQGAVDAIRKRLLAALGVSNPPQP